MATPYRFTPRIPVPPNPTPLSATVYTHSNHKAKRPPIHNPYDKFTQPEFDAWIGDITGALKRALGQIEADVEPKPHERTQVSTGNATTRYRPIDLDESEDEAVNDSFAEIKARRALGKGKARDPREGPGLGGADRMKPIEIISSDEEEEKEVELSVELDNDSSDEGEDEDYSEQEEDYSWKRGQSSSQQIYSPDKRRKYIQEVSEEYDSEEGSEEDGEEPITRKYRPAEVIDIVSGDEDEMDDDRRDGGHREEEELGVELEEGSEATGEEYSEEEPVRLGTSHLKFHAARISISRDSRHFHHSDEEETKYETEMVEDDDVIEEIQPPEGNTAFPLQVPLVPVNRHIEIRDPWAGPRIYAEDNYTGGDVRPLPGTRRDPHHLGDYDSYEIEEIIPDATDDGMQIAEQDTLFTPHNEEQERPVDISVSCLGPQAYAEDSYADGDVRIHPGQEIDPSLLEGNVQDDIRVPSASEIVTRDRQDYEDPIQDEEQLEDELEHDEAIIQPPTQHAFTFTSRLALPAPANGELVSIADSEPGSADQEPTKLGPLEVVEVDFHELQHEDVDKQGLEREQFLDVDEIIEEDTANTHPTPPLGPTPPSEADIPIATWPLSGSSDQQDDMSTDQYESLYANIEAVAVQTEEQAEVISTLVDWNYPPAFPAGIPTSAPGHLATPSSEESSASVEEPAVLDTEIDFIELVDKESSPLPSVHEKVITQAEKDFDDEPAKNTETFVDDVALSITEAALVEDSEPQLTSQTLVVDPSFSHTASNDLVNDAWIAEHDESVMAKETTEGRKIEVGITSEDVTQLDDEDSANESAPVQQNSEDIVDEIGSRDVNTSIQETKIHMGVNGLPVVLNSQVAATKARDDIPSLAEGIDEQIDSPTQPFASTSSTQIPVLVHNPHQYDYDQLPTPPPDQSPTVQSPSVANDDTFSSSKFPPRRHKVEIEEVQDEDDIRPQPISAESAEFDLRMDDEQASEPGYIVVEPEPDAEYADEDADGEIDGDVEIVSVSSASHVWDEAQSRNGEMQSSMDYFVEEPLTDGRLTEEPGDRAHSPGIVSAEPEESEAHYTHFETIAMQDIPFSTDKELLSLAEASSQVGTSSHPGLEGPTDSSEPPIHATPGSIAPTGEHIVPMPVTADANVVDPTTFPDTPSSISPIPVASDVQPQAQRWAPGDGLFIPADESTAVTPESPFEGIHHQILDELAHVFFATPAVPSTPLAELIPAGLSSEISPVIDRAVEQIEALQPVQLPPIDAAATHISDAHTSGNMHAATSRDGLISVTSPPLRDLTALVHVTLTRKPTDPILVSDPYPYSLSTPGVSLVDPTEEDTEHDNSLSSNSTWEKDLEDKDTNNILDDGDELELQYPPEPDVLADLNGLATAEGEEASKIVEGVADFDADGEFDPDFVVTHLSRPSVEIQLEANPPKLITSDSTREILPIDPAKGVSSGDFPLTETANHDLPEASTTPLNEIAVTSSSTQANKRKRDSLPPHDKAAVEKVGNGKNKKVAKSAGKGKTKPTKPTNHDIVNQTTNEATIHVKPRRKTQSVESVARLALSKKPSETSTSSRSSSGASAYRLLRPSSRSSSVASSVPSDQSVAVPPSPTVHKPNVSSAQTSQQPISLLHAHGLKRNNQNNQSQSSQARANPTQVSKPSIQRVISLPRINDFGSTAVTSPPAVVTPPTANVKTAPSTTVRHGPVMSSSPLVTRSHCRYHRISLPREEGGPRVCFLVPGCSLSDRELMAAEEIEDHGDATHGDSLRMIKDIQSLDFDSYLIGILRQLVGLDILREQEVFYLPQPGEEVVRKTSPRKERSGLFRGAESSSYTGSPGYSGSVRSPTSMKAPASVADSTSTSLSAFRRRLGSEKGSVSAVSDTESEPSDAELPDAKRARPSPPDEQGSAGPMGPPLKAQGKRRLKSRRSKQIDVSYQPEETHDGNSDDAQFSDRRKKPSKRGVKRRGSEITAKDGGDEHITKKVKRRRSAPMPQALAVGDSTT